MGSAAIALRDRRPAVPVTPRVSAVLRSASAHAIARSDVDTHGVPMLHVSALRSPAELHVKEPSYDQRKAFMALYPKMAQDVIHEVHAIFSPYDPRDTTW